MITKAEYEAAKYVVEAYQRQMFRKNTTAPSVRLSAFGKEVQTPHEKLGKVVTRTLAGMTDYSVEVLWEDGQKEWMHEHQIEIVKP